MYTLGHRHIDQQLLVSRIGPDVYSRCLCDMMVSFVAVNGLERMYRLVMIVLSTRPPWISSMMRRRTAATSQWCKQESLNRAQLKFQASWAVLPGNDISRTLGAGVAAALSSIPGCLLDMPALLFRVNTSLSLPSRRPSTIFSSMASTRAMTQCLS